MFKEDTRSALSIYIGSVNFGPKYLELIVVHDKLPSLTQSVSEIVEKFESKSYLGNRLECSVPVCPVLYIYILLAHNQTM